MKGAYKDKKFLKVSIESGPYEEIKLRGAEIQYIYTT